MSVWPVAEPSAALSGSEGALVSVSIGVRARDLESLLEALARLPFPINPEICHGAEVAPRGGVFGESEPSTLVEFPAYAGRIAEVRAELERSGFHRSALRIASMLDEIQGECRRRGADSHLARGATNRAAAAT
ncbi:MAG TPA: hypothetical protein VMU19_12310 [Bryobacteraceae bacterium]|nr:hypothetical protein [Bryobacteraceae bacterium]